MIIIVFKSIKNVKSKLTKAQQLTSTVSVMVIKSLAEEVGL